MNVNNILNYAHFQSLSDQHKYTWQMINLSVFRIHVND